MNRQEKSPGAVDREALIGFTQKLVQCRSFNPPGNEKDAAAIAGGQMEKLGMDVELSEAAPGRFNAYGRIRGTGGGKRGNLLMVGHLDTVPPGSGKWERDPLSGEISRGKLYGRGSADMKSGLASVIFAAGAFRGSESLLEGDLIVAGTAGEEVDCLGAKKLVEDGILEGVGAIAIPEPSGLKMFTAHKGALWVRVRTRGKGAHGARPDLGINAVIHINETINRIMKEDWDAEAHPLLGKPTVNIGTVSGGVSTNVVPDQAELTIDFRSLPQQNHSDILEKLKKILKQLEKDIPGYNAEIEVINDKAAVSTNADSLFVKTAAEAGRLLWGRPLKPHGVTYYTDASILAHASKKPVVILGPGEAEQAHQTDEWVGTESICSAAEYYIRLIHLWMGKV